MFNRMLFRAVRLLLAWLIAGVAVGLSTRPTTYARVPASIDEGSSHNGNSITNAKWIILTDEGPSPLTVTIPVGTDIYWHNTTNRTQVLQGYRDGIFLPLVLTATNSSTASFASAPTPKSLLSSTQVFSATIVPNGIFPHLFSSPGTFSYTLSGSPGVRGRINVQDPSTPVQIRIWAPEGIVGDDLRVVVSQITAPNPIQHVIASVGERVAELPFSQEAYCIGFGPRRICYPGWAGDLSLAGMPRGLTQLTVQATDTIGNTGQTQTLINHDLPPKLNISAPRDYALARPQIRVDLTCQDDDPAGCAELRVSASEIDHSLIRTGVVTTVNQLVSLAPLDGRAVTLTFEARDSVGQVVSTERTVWVEQSSRLVEVEHIDLGQMHRIPGADRGGIQSVQSDRLLYLDTSGDTGVFKIRQRATGQESEIESIAGKAPYQGFLTPKGAVFAAMDVSTYRFDLFEWRDGQIISLGGVNGWPMVSGNYVGWVGPTSVDNPYEPSLFLRDLLTETTTLVASNAPNNDNDLAANGDVVYWGARGYPTSQIWRYRGGVSTRLSSDTSLENIYPVTDGINVVYRKITPYCFCTDQPQMSTLMLYDSNGQETILAPARGYLLGTHGSEYMVDSGWIVFTRSDANGIVQVWLRDPAGVERQITASNDPEDHGNYIQNFSPEGGTIYVHNNRLYLSRPGLADVDIAASSSLYQTYWLDGQWYLAIWGYLFKVVP